MIETDPINKDFYEEEYATYLDQIEKGIINDPDFKRWLVTLANYYGEKDRPFTAYLEQLISGQSKQASQEDKLWSIVVDLFFTKHSRWSDVIKSIRSIYPNITDSVILSLKDRVKKSLDNQMGMIGSKKVASERSEDVLWIAPDSKTFHVTEGSHLMWIQSHLDLLKKYGIEPLTDASNEDELNDMWDRMLRDGWIRVSDDFLDFIIDMYSMKNIPPIIERIVINADPESVTIEDLGSSVVLDKEQYSQGLQKAVNKALQQKRLQPVTAKRHLNMDQVIKILDSKEPKIDHIDFTDNSVTLTDNTKLTFDQATQKAMEIDKEGTFDGSQFSNTDWCVNPSLGSGPFDSPEDHGAKPQKGSFPSLSWQPAGEESKDEQPSSNVASNLDKPFSKKAYSPNILSWASHDPQIVQYFKERGLDIKDIKKSLPYLNIKYWDASSPATSREGESTVGQIESQEPGFKFEKSYRAYYYPPTGEIFVNPTLSLDEARGTLIHEIEHALQDSEGLIPSPKEFQDTPYDIRTHEWGAELSTVRALKNRGYSLEQVLQYNVDRANKEYKLILPYTIKNMSEEARNKIEQLYELAGEVEPQSVVSKKLSKLDIKANPQSRYWLDPSGKEYEVSGSHGHWIKFNADLLKKYGINVNKGGDLTPAYNQMYNTGWTRISNEPAGTGFVILVEDIRKLPSYLDNFIAKNFSEGDTVHVGASNGNIYVSDPFPSIQKAVNKALRNPVNASLKQADVSGHFINDILHSIESTGGVTYSLSKGNLAGTNNFSVSIYPNKEQIIEGVADYDDIENYIDTNEDLLSNPNNAFGAWGHEGKIWYDVVVAIPNKEQALKLAREHNQLAIYDLAKGQEISTGIQRQVAFCKKDIVKKAEESPLTEDQANQISSVSCPAYVIALNNYYEAVKRGHNKERSVQYAIFSVKNLEKIDEKKLVEFINTYLGPVK